MSVAAAINILLRGNTTDFDSKMLAAEKKLRGLFKSLGSGGGPVLGEIRNAFNQAFSTDALREVFDQVVQLGRVADRLDILPEKLAGLQLAANAAGVDFGELTSAVQKMLLAVSGAGDPLKKAAADTAFNKLGISAASLKNLAPEQQLATIADALANVQNVADRVNIAKGIFGKGGVPILNVLRDGKKGLEAWQKAAEDAGLALNKVEVGKFEKVEQTFKLLKAQLQGIAIEIWNLLGPRIIWLGQVLLAVSKIALDFFAKWGQQIKWLIELWVAYKAVTWAVVAAERAKAAIEAVSAVLEDKSIKGIAAKIVAMVGLAAAVGAAAVAIDKALDKFADGFKNMPLPELGKLEGVDPEEFNKMMQGPKHPGALIKGSVEAYSAIVNAGGSVMGQVAKNTKRGADNGQAILKQLQKAPVLAPANLGGR